MLRLSRRIYERIFYLLPLILYMLDTMANILQGPENATGFIGGSVSFSCIISDSEKQEIYWVKSDKGALMVLDESVPNISTSLKGSLFSLTINELSIPDEGKYYCWDGSTSESASLTVNALPTMDITILPADPSLRKINTIITVTCKAIGAKPAVNITIFIDGNLVDPSLVKSEVERSSEGHDGTKTTVSMYRALFSTNDKVVECIPSSGTKESQKLNLNVVDTKETEGVTPRQKEEPPHIRWMIILILIIIILFIAAVIVLKCTMKNTHQEGNWCTIESDG